MSFSAKKYFDKNKRAVLSETNGSVLKKSLVYDLRLSSDDRVQIFQRINTRLVNHTTRFKNRLFSHESC